MKIATVYERADNWYFMPSSRTVNGLWVAALPLASADKHDSPGHKGQLLLTALENSRTDIPTPSNPTELITPLLRKTGVKSWATFMNGAKCTSVELDGGLLRFIPQRKLKHPKGALESVREHSCELPLGVSAQVIWHALEAALQVSA